MSVGVRRTAGMAGTGGGASRGEGAGGGEEERRRGEGTTMEWERWWRDFVRFAGAGESMSGRGRVKERGVMGEEADEHEDVDEEEDVDEQEEEELRESIVRREDLRLRRESDDWSLRFEQERAEKRERSMPWSEVSDVCERGWRIRSWGDGSGSGSKTGDGARGGGEAGRAKMELAGIVGVGVDFWWSLDESFITRPSEIRKIRYNRSRSRSTKIRSSYYSFSGHSDSLDAFPIASRLPPHPPSYFIYVLTSTSLFQSLRFPSNHPQSLYSIHVRA